MELGRRHAPRTILTTSRSAGVTAERGEVGQLDSGPIFAHSSYLQLFKRDVQLRSQRLSVGAAPDYRNSGRRR